MKGKIPKILRVGLALVLALSLSLVMAVPVSADVSSISVTNDPQTEGRAAEYTIDFTTTAALFTGASNTIIITFPTDTTVPGTITATLVTVNGTECATVTVSGLAVTITVPKDIPAGAVEVVIALDAAIKNPDSVATDWILTVHTSAETDPVNSATYSTIAVVAPYIVSVAGTAYQNSNDSIVITFSEAVVAVDTDWSTNEFTSIKCGGIALDLPNADFTFAAKVLTITLDEATDKAYLEIGTDNLEVIPATDKIKNTAEDASVGITPVLGSVTGDTVAPTVALTYDDADKLVKEADDLVITATFSEAMAITPTIAIDTQGTDLEAVAFTGGSGASWTYTYTVPAASDGTATVTISGTDLAGNANATATNNTFVIDNTAPTIAVTDIVGTTISGAGDTIVITFDEAVTATDGTWSANEFTTIESVVDTTPTTLTLTNAVFAYASGTLTITLDEATDGEYLVNGETLTVTPASAAIKDIALNAMAITAVVGTAVVSGDVTAPTITGIVGIQDTLDIIKVVFSEAVVPAEATPGWSLNEVALVESPDGAPLNVTHATFAIDGTDTVLTITLNATDAASLVVGEVVLVTPATDAIVDLAGNALAAVEVSSGEAAGLLSVWVDVDGTSAWLAEPTHFANIEDAIAAVAIGGTVNVAAGTYTPASTLTIATVGLTLQSDDGAAVTIINTGATDANYDILITASTVTVDGFTVALPVHAIKVTGADATIMNNVITRTSGYPEVWLASTATGATVSGNVLAKEVTMMVMGVSNVTLSDNTFGAGINLESASAIDITGNTITGAEYVGIRFASGSFDDILIQDNTISLTTIAGDDQDAAIAFRNAVVTVTNLTITGNDIIDNVDAGIKIGTITTWGAGNTINNNNISGNDDANDDYGIENKTATSVDAEDNWWGSAVESAIKVTTYVDYSPWLDAPYPNGEPTTTDSPTIEYSITLVAGWNLISLPLVQIDPGIATVLALSGATIDKVAYYTGGTAGSWLSYSPPAPGNLDYMYDGKGYWMDVSVAGELLAYGVELAIPGQAPPTYDLVVGWNLIGFTSTTDYDAELYLGSVMDTVQAMYKYDASSGLYVPIITTTDLVQGQGYWLAVDTAGKIYP